MSNDVWQIFTLDELAKKVEGKTPRIYEFLRGPALSCAVYRLPAGARDMQAPHVEDEVYFVVSGRAKLRVAGQEREVAPGNILYVRATSMHSFFAVEEDLLLIAMFGASHWP